MKRLLLIVLLAGCPKPSDGVGEQGPVGPQGPKGDPGDPGAQGAAGMTGPTGPQGSMGLQGPMGQVLVLDGGVVTGPQGARGVSVLLRDAGTCVIVSYEDGGSPFMICQGPAGAQGLQGTQGVAGPQGMQGAQGNAGAPGTPGMPGTAGAPGSVGAQGPQGPPGPAGPALYLDGGALPVSSTDGYAFAGYTTGLYDGNLGGPIGSNAKCAAELPGSHLCTDRELFWAGPSAAPGDAGFWADSAQYSSSSEPNYYPRDRDFSYACNNWRSNDGPSNYAHYWDTQGAEVSGYSLCNMPRQLACCRSAQAAWFRGFTAAQYDGNLGGPLGANAKCSAQFPRAHLCTDRELQWSGSGLTPPAAGYWADSAQYSSSSEPNYYPRDRDFSYACNNWRSNDGPSNYAHYWDTQGAEVSGYNLCNAPRALACCGG